MSAFHDAVRLAELDLGVRLRTWRARIEAVNAEVFDGHDAGLILGLAIGLVIAPANARERSRWQRAASKLLSAVWHDTSGRSAVARTILLRLGDRADAIEALEEV